MHLKTSFNVENVIFYWTSSGCLRFLAYHTNTMAAAALHWRGDWLGTWLIFFPRFPLSCLQMHTSSQRRVLSKAGSRGWWQRAPITVPRPGPRLYLARCLAADQIHYPPPPLHRGDSRGWWLLLLWLLPHNDHGPQVSTSNWAFSCKIWWK